MLGPEFLHSPLSILIHHIVRGYSCPRRTVWKFIENIHVQTHACQFRCTRFLHQNCSLVLKFSFVIELNFPVTKVMIGHCLFLLRLSISVCGCGRCECSLISCAGLPCVRQQTARRGVGCVGSGDRLNPRPNIS